MREFHQPNDQYHYVIGPHAEPIAHIAPGEQVVIHTIDSSGNVVTSEDQKPSEVMGKYVNPQTGPFFIDGAEPGDTLVVHIDKIEATRDWAFSALVPYFGALTSTRWTRSLQPALEERIWIYHRTERNTFAWKDRWEVPWAPFYGTMGTAPDLESLSALSPGDHGGNMDVPDVTEGNTLYFPVRHPGALFYVGDAHAAQGHGELCGVALEISAKGTFRFDLIKNQPINWPRIESPTELMSVGSARPMEDAARIAYVDLIEWIARDYGFDPLDAYQLLTQLGKCYVGNMVDTTYSLVAKVDKNVLRPLPGSPAAARS